MPVASVALEILAKIIENSHFFLFRLYFLYCSKHDSPTVNVVKENHF